MAESFDGKRVLDSSGSSMVVAMMVEDMCYIAHLGSSAAILSQNKGKTVLQLTEEHIPSVEKEAARILLSGGSIYQNQPIFT